jgi:thymidylate kinase
MNEIQWNVSGLILEGISGTGKTEILKTILRSDRFVKKGFLSSYIMSEHQTQRVLEKKDREEGLTIADNLSLLNEHLENIERLTKRLDAMEWCRCKQTAMRIPYILERFHFTHVYQYDHMGWGDVIPVDERLEELNARAVILTADRSLLAERIFTGRDAMWRNYISRFGKTEDEILDHFERRQEELKAMVQKSLLPVAFFDTTEDSPETVAEKIMDFWGAI